MYMYKGLPLHLVGAYLILQVIWEYLGDDGLWQSLPSETSFTIEENYCDQKNTFGLGSSEEDLYQYNLGSMSRVLVKNKQSQRIKRTPFVWDKPESEYTCIHHQLLLPARDQSIHTHSRYM